MSEVRFTKEKAGYFPLDLSAYFETVAAAFDKKAVQSERYWLLHICEFTVTSARLAATITHEKIKARRVPKTISFPIFADEAAA